MLLRKKNVSNKRCRDNDNKHFKFSKVFPKIVPFMRQCGKNIVVLDNPRMTVGRIFVAVWITKAIYVHS